MTTKLILNNLTVYRSRAPLRLGWAGGGSDVSPYSDSHGGYVLNSTIDLYANCTISARSDDHCLLSMPDSGLSEKVPAVVSMPTTGPFCLIKGVYNRIVRDFNQSRPLPCNITTYSDAPIGSGLGASSTLVVALISSFREWLSLPLGEYDIAHLAYEIERIELGLQGGRQDQYAAAFGGTNFIEFYGQDRVIVNPLRIKDWILDELEASLVLYYTGVSRESAQIIKKQIDRAQSDDPEYISTLSAVKQDAVSMKQALLRGELGEFARILGQAWKNKKSMAEGITNDSINKVYDLAISAGAFAGKISGAGGGGFMMFIVEPTCRNKVETVLRSQSGTLLKARFTSKGAHSWKAKVPSVSMPASGSL
jgi:D-glycero-alpha-D-manno-heptose-7-phosphate kinase